ncbi:MAG TPA: superoxide dismutase [Usitatibacter sp.]|jgi:Fe-Mn family superoxide dismutase|nr:superoxide dismutase [Usitatibacter sp.]
MADTSGPFQLPPLPWDQAALDPVISARTIEFHYGKHHRAYVTNLNGLVAGTRFADMPLEQVVKETAQGDDNRKIFNNAAQTWNHTFFWNCLKKGGGGKPTGNIAQRIESDCGGYDAFKKKLLDTAVATFGSGWAWLVEKNGKLDIVSTSNAGNPMTSGATPILTIDVWEHAYYLDYQNRRPDFTTAVIEKLLNWDFANQCLDKSKSSQRQTA